MVKYFLPRVALLATLGFGCASLQTPQNIDLTEITCKDNWIFGQMALELESLLVIRNDPQLTADLQKLAEDLVSGLPGFSGSAVKVVIFSKGANHWMSYGIPGLGVYLSSQALKEIEYENELAAWLAFELGYWRIKSRFCSILLDDELEVSDQGQQTAIQSAVQMLRHSGYDVRGLFLFLQKVKKYGVFSRDDTASMDLLLDYARREASLYPPLRNPVIQSQRFIAIKKRIQKL